ncbi:MAG: CRISPR system precrRNA processing endoribonuclease RAMP protein Cas6 [Phascolarctobacterium sp.]|nr:CRISPR system precrRNA processing endoribonuclease RAMP protein Cas6 [Candidatus Phascolarctobacterium caballi]
MKPLTILELALSDSNELKIHQSMGSIFHGALMELLNSDYVEFLHTMQLRPYSQCLYFNRDKGVWLWRLSTFEQNATENILQKVENLQKLYLKQKQAEVQFLSCEVKAESDYRELLDKHFAQTRQERYILLNFLSPASFKSNGEYMFYPTPRLILGSLLNKWNTCSEVKLEESNLLENLTAETYIAGYKLASRKFELEGSMVPGFRGEFTLGLRGNIMANRIIRLLAEFAQFAGVGMKTALGMGGINLEFR